MIISQRKFLATKSGSSFSKPYLKVPNWNYWRPKILELKK